MEGLLYRLARRTPLYRSVIHALQRREERAWRAAGKPGAPPPAAKQDVLLEHAQRAGLRTLVETGTFRGDMVFAMLPHFDRIVSIELDAALHARARTLFAQEPKVELLQGDSGALLPQVVASLRAPALFWLDAHYSGGITARGALDSPIVRELETVLGSPHPHVVLIDDAADFTGKDGYPTLDELRTYLSKRDPSLRMEVADNIVRVLR